MNKQKIIYLILTISVLISFTACNDAEDSIPKKATTDTTLSEKVTSIEPSDIDFISSSTEGTVSSLDYTLPDDETVVESTSTEENTTIVTYINTSDENTTTPPEEKTVITIEYTTGFVGKLVDSYISGVDYTCDGKTKKTDYLGQFNCETTPIEFSLGNLLLGSIEKMTDDYLIFPQDLLGLQRGAALHPEVAKMIIIFQSLDNDANPENGIIISQETIQLLNQEFTQITNIQNITLIQLTDGIERLIQNNLQNNQASQLQLVAIKQAQDHLLKSLSTILISPTQP